MLNDDDKKGHFYFTELVNGYSNSKNFYDAITVLEEYFSPFFSMQKQKFA